MSDPAPAAEPVVAPDVEQPRPGRRQVLTVAGAGVVTAALASCTPLAPVTSAASSSSGSAGSGSSVAPKVVATDPAAAGVAGVAGAPRTSAQLPILRAQSVVADGAPVPNLVGTDPVWHLLRRATFGPTQALVAEVRASGSSAWLEQQLNPASIDDSACDAYLTRYPALPMTTMQIRAAYPAYSWGPMYELGRATLARALFSKRQLFEVMVEFWSNHFNVTSPSGEAWDLKVVEDREVIRRNALGKFSALLQASAQERRDGPLPRQLIQLAGHPQRELRPRTARTPHRRPGRRLHPGRGRRLRPPHDRLHRRPPRRIRLLQRLALPRPRQGPRASAAPTTTTSTACTSPRPTSTTSPTTPPPQPASPPNSPPGSSPTPHRPASSPCSPTPTSPTTPPSSPSCGPCSPAPNSPPASARRPSDPSKTSSAPSASSASPPPPATPTASPTSTGRSATSASNPSTGVRPTASPTSPAPGCPPAACSAGGTPTWASSRAGGTTA